MRKIAAASAILVLLALAGCSGSEPAVQLTGTVDVPSGLQNRLDGGSGCMPTDGYDDVDTGTSVTIRDENGKTIGTAQLGDGEKTGDLQPFNGNSAFPCTFSFTTSVPAAEFYSVEVGSRGEVTFSRADVEADAVALTLGF